MPSRGLSILVAFGAACLAACGGGGTPSPPPAHQIAKSTGDSQVVNVGTQVQLQVLVTDTGGHPVADVPVAWAAVGGALSVASSNSDALGIATITLTLPASAATVTTTATKVGLVGSPVTFTSFAQVNGAYRIQKFANDSQTDTVLSTLGNPFRVHVTDYQGNNVTTYTVNWAATGGGGAVGAPTSNTDGSGIAQITRTLGATAGPQTASAAVTGLIGSPITFTGIATHGHATTFALNNQSDTTGIVSSTLSYGVEASDAHGNPVSGISVAWAVVAGGGSNNPTSNSTAVNGVAVTAHTLGSSAGPDTVTATSTPALTGSPVSFAARITALPLAAAVTVGPGIVFAPDSVRIAVGGKVTWTWAPASLSHSVEWLTAPGTLPTNSSIMTSGSYFITFTQAGTYTYDCIVHGSAMSGKVVVQ
ncbi:MAG TPA: Ig-like domain-containing protein [Gemmatimonadales bacterium]|nr:Ig-like domain-containing protein [Gemmatimonadales bacterium]